MKRTLLLTALLLWAGITSQAAVSQWVAFNDHYRGPNTGTNVSAWTIFTTGGGNPPGNSGFLTNAASGAALPVTITVTNVATAAVSSGNNSSGPAEGTPAALAFTNYIDFGLGAPASNAVQCAGSSRVAHIFRGCNPARRYSWRGTAARANNNTDRWTLVEIAAASSTPNHAATPVALRTYFTTADIAALTATQVVCNFGENRAAGMLAGWDDIVPNPDGTIIIYCSTWRSTMPAGYSSAGSYGYAVTADRLEEFSINPDSELAITNQPQSLSVTEGGTATFTVGVSGEGANFHWSRGGVPIAGATGPSYSINSVNYLADHNSQFQVIASNSVNSIASDVATLTVLRDLDPPVPILAVAAADGTNITISFNEPVSLDSTNVSSFYVSPPDTETAATAVRSNGTNILITLLPVNALVPGQNYVIVVNSIKDASPSANVMPAPVAIPIRRLVQMIGFNTDNLWKYSTETNLFGTGWETTGYDDTGAAWLSGPGGLGHESDVRGPIPGTNGVPIRTHINYMSNSAPYFFRKHFYLPSTTSGVQLSLRDVAEDGAVFYINGQEVLRHNVGSGVLSVASRAAATQPDPTPVQGPFPLPLTGLVPGDNVMAVVVLQNGATSSDMELAVELTANIPQYVALTTVLASIDSGTGEVTLTWTGVGTLEEASALLDGDQTVWTPVADGPGSPYTFTPSGAHRFFRVR